MFTLSLLLSLRVRLSLVTKTVSTLIFSSHSFSKGLMKWSRGTKAGWKNSPYAHLPLGGKPQASCTPFQRSPGLARQTTSKQRKLLVENILFMYLEPKKMTWEYYVVSGFWNPLQGYGITILSLQWILQNIHHLEICKANSFRALVSALLGRQLFLLRYSDKSLCCIVGAFPWRVLCRTKDVSTTNSWTFRLIRKTFCLIHHLSNKGRCWRMMLETMAIEGLLDRRRTC